MRFSWTDEQEMLRSTLGKFIEQRYHADFRKSRLSRGFDATIWNELADLGILGLGFAEQYGGSGGSALDTLIVMEAFGRGLVIEPYLASIILGGGLVRHAGDERQRAQLLPRLIAGELRLAFGYAEDQSRFNLAHVTLRADKTSSGYILKGRKILVLGAPDAQMLLISARTNGAPLDRDGISLFLVPRDAQGVTMRAYTCIDGMSAADVALQSVQVSHDDMVGILHGALPSIEQVVDEATSAVCGEAVGAMAALNERCIAFAKTRQAFGKPIAQFQVIGHRLVDMAVSYEQAAAIAVKCALKLSIATPEAARTVSACKVAVAKESAFVAKSAVQLHGAMGTTEELDVGHYFKRLMTLQSLFGSSLYHLRRYTELDDSNGVLDGH